MAVSCKRRHDHLVSGGKRNQVKMTEHAGHSESHGTSKMYIYIDSY